MTGACLSSTQIIRDADVTYLSSCKIEQKFCRVHRNLRNEPHWWEIFKGISSPPVVNRVAFRNEQKLVKHVKHSTWRLVYRRDYCPSRLKKMNIIFFIWLSWNSFFKYFWNKCIRQYNIPWQVLEVSAESCWQKSNQGRKLAHRATKVKDQPRFRSQC